MTTYERELVNILWSLEYGVLRCPGSGGSGADRPLPDIIAGQPTQGPNGYRLSKCMVIEHKSGSDTTLYVDGGEVAGLKAFAEYFGATPYLAARFTTQASPTAHFLVRPENARMTDSGNYGLPIEDIEDRAAVVFHE